MQEIRESGVQGHRVEKLPSLPAVKNYKDLLVWQQAMELITLIYTATKQFPKDELYGLTSQIRRAAVSVAANISEGNTRDYRKEYLHFLSISIGSLAEVQTLLAIAKRLDYIAEPEFVAAEDVADKTFKMIKNLQRSLKNKP